MVQYVNARAVADAALQNDRDDPSSRSITAIPRRSHFKRFRSATLRNNVFPAAVAIQLTFIVVLLLGHMNGNNNQLEPASSSAGEASVRHSQPVSDVNRGWLDEPRPVLAEPLECAEWKEVATNPAKLRVYRKHFTNHDKSRW
jgi:hypothetical protein